MEPYSLDEHSCYCSCVLAVCQVRSWPMTPKVSPYIRVSRARLCSYMSWTSTEASASALCSVSGKTETHATLSKLCWLVCMPMSLSCSQQRAQRADCDVFTLMHGNSLESPMLAGGFPTFFADLHRLWPRMHVINPASHALAATSGVTRHRLCTMQ